MLLVGLVGAALAGLLTWKFIDLENDIRVLRIRIEDLEDERIIKVVDPDEVINDDIPF